MRVPDFEVRSKSHFKNVLASFFDKSYIDIRTFYCTVSIYFKAQVKNIICSLPFSATKVGVRGIIGRCTVIPRFDVQFIHFSVPSCSF